MHKKYDNFKMQIEGFLETIKEDFDPAKIQLQQDQRDVSTYRQKVNSDRENYSR